MNPFINDILGGVIRIGVAAVIGYLVKEQLLTADQSEAWITAITGGTVVLVWSIWNKFKSRQKLLTAMASPAGANEKAIEASVAAGKAPPVSLPKTAVPYLNAP